MTDQVAEVPAGRVLVLWFVIGHEPQVLHCVLVLDGHDFVEVAQVALIKWQILQPKSMQLLRGNGPKRLGNILAHRVDILLAIHHQLHEIGGVVLAVELQKLIPNGGTAEGILIPGGKLS